MPKNPVRETKSIVNDSGASYVNRILIGTPATGLVRIEWASARYSQTIPMNWSQVQILQYYDSYVPLRYQVDDAQNLIVRECLKGDFEWLFLLEHDVLLPDTTFMKLNQYMREGKYPIISGLYYSRGRPSEPLVFKGRGNSVFDKFSIGDMVWCDGVPTGCLLIHHSILRLMWNESPEYIIRRPWGVEITRRVFETPRFEDVAGGMHNMVSGTSDLYWCDRVIKDNVLERTGWTVPDPTNPFLVDTSIFCKHINPDGEQFP